MGRVNARRRMLVVLSAGVLFALSAVLGTVALAKPGGEKQGTKGGAYAVTEQIGPTAVAAPSVQEGSRATAAASSCRDIGSRISYYNGGGKLMAYFQAVQSWCFDGRVITSVGRMQVNTVITDLGKSSNWKYQGLVESSGKFRDYNRTHVGIRQGRFTYQGSNGKSQKLPYVKLVKYYNGGGYSDTKE